MAVILECEFAAAPGRNASADAGGVQVTEIDEQVPLIVRCDSSIQYDRFDIGFDPSNSRSFIEDPPIADHHQAGSVAHVIERDDFRRQLRADASGIAHGEGDHRLAVTTPDIHGCPSGRFASIQYRLSRRVHMRDLQNERQQQQGNPRQHQRRHERIAEEDRKRTLRHQHCLSERILRLVPDDNREHKRSERI